MVSLSPEDRYCVVTETPSVTGNTEVLLSRTRPVSLEGSDVPLDVYPEDVVSFVVGSWFVRTGRPSPCLLLGSPGTVRHGRLLLPSPPGLREGRPLGVGPEQNRVRTSHPPQKIVLDGPYSDLDPRPSVPSLVLRPPPTPSCLCSPQRSSVPTDGE